MTTSFATTLVEVQPKLSFPFGTYLGREIPLEEFFRDFYWPPEITSTHAHDLSRTITVGMPGQRVAITGALGAGKTTYLLAQYMETVEREPPGRALFLSLDELLQNAETLEQVRRQPDRILFVDSVDETAADLDRSQLNAVIDTLLALPHVTLACRVPFFKECFDDPRRRKLDAVLEISPFSRDQQLTLIERFIHLVGGDRVRTEPDLVRRARDLASRCRSGARVEESLVATPLFSALFALVALDQRDDHKLAGVTEVYAAFAHALAERKFPRSRAALEMLSSIAWQLDEAERARRAVRMKELAVHTRRTAEKLRDLVQVRPAMNHGDEVVRGFRHRSFGEFLVARHVAVALESREVRQGEITQVFGKLYNYETSFFIRQLVADSERRTVIVRRLRAYVERHLTRTTGREVAATHNALYFASACDDHADSFLRRIAQSALAAPTELHPLVFGTLVSAVISRGCHELYVDLLRCIEDHESFVLRNLNYHMLYYGDAEFRDPTMLARPLHSATQWEGTRRVLLQRLAAEDDKRRAFRLFDLMTLRQFVKLTRYRFDADERSKLRIVIDSIDLVGMRPEVAKELRRQAALLLTGLRQPSHSHPATKQARKRGTIRSAPAIRADALIVTAVKDEWDAVLDVATGTAPGGRWTPLSGTNGPETLVCDFTAEGGGVLTLAVVQAFRMGRESAVAAAAPLLVTHPEIRCLAMCGVCAGRRGDVALGDVIIADRAWPYDAGKRKATHNKKGERTERFQGDMELYRIHPPEWRQRAERFKIEPSIRWLRMRPRSFEEQADWLLERLETEEDPQSHPHRKRRCPDWGAVLKQLRKTGWLKKHKIEPTDAGHKHIRRRLLHEPDGLRKPAPFKVEVGPIASGAPVVQDPTIFERLSDTAAMRKVIGLEMETSAILELAYLQKLPFAVVMKGVMDHADEFKSDNMKPFAAMASAECLIAFLRQNLPPR